jgi:hypothetical protein
MSQYTNVFKPDFATPPAHDWRWVRGVRPPLAAGGRGRAACICACTRACVHACVRACVHACDPLGGPQACPWGPPPRPRLHACPSHLDHPFAPPPREVAGRRRAGWATHPSTLSTGRPSAPTSAAAWWAARLVPRMTPGQVGGASRPAVLGRAGRVGGAHALPAGCSARVHAHTARSCTHSTINGLQRPVPLIHMQAATSLTPARWAPRSTRARATRSAPSWAPATGVGPGGAGGSRRGGAGRARAHRRR